MNDFARTKLSGILTPIERGVVPIPGTKYRQLGVRLWGKGAYERDTIDGADTQYKVLFQVKAGDVVVNKIWARNGSVAVVPPELDGALVSSEFPTFVPVPDKLEPTWFHWVTRTEDFWHQCDLLSRGASGKNRIRPEKFLEVEIPLAPLLQQRRIIVKVQKAMVELGDLRQITSSLSTKTKLLKSVTKLVLMKKAAEEKWSRMSIEDVACITMGSSPSGDSYNDVREGVPLLNGPTEFGEVHPTPVQWTTAPSSVCSEGDILLCVRGATVGRMNWADQEYCIGRGLASLSVDSKKFVPQYVYHLVDLCVEELRAMSNKYMTFPNLSREKLALMTIPVPSIPRQEETSSFLSNIFEAIARLNITYDQTATDLQNIEKSILDRMFSGQL